MRSKPSAYLIYCPDDPRSVHLWAIDTAFLAFRNTSTTCSSVGCGSATQLNMTLQADGSLVVFDDGIGLSVDDDAIEVCFTNPEQCKQRRQTSLAVLNALSEQIDYETAQAGYRWRYRCQYGKPIGGLERLEARSEQWQKLTITPDDNVFDHPLNMDGFCEMFQRGLNGDPPFVEPFRYAVEEVPVVVIDAKSGQQRHLVTTG